MNTLKLALEGVEKERDYYFSKLREVEVLCQEQGEENAPFVDRLMEILYAADEQVCLQPLTELCMFSGKSEAVFLPICSSVYQQYNVVLVSFFVFVLTSGGLYCVVKTDKNSVFVWNYVFAWERTAAVLLISCLCLHFSACFRKEQSWLRVMERKWNSKPMKRQQMISRRSRMNTDGFHRSSTAVF